MGLGCPVGLVVALVVAWLPSLAPGAAGEVSGPTTRLAGPERIQTATSISQRSGVTTRRRWWSWPAAMCQPMLAAAPLAVDAGPVLLLRGNARPAATTDEIQRVLSPDDLVLLVGGTAALSAAVEAPVDALGMTTQRIAGPNRFATTVEVFESGRDGVPRESFGVWLADGRGFADALLAGSVAGRAGASVVLLTDGERMPAETMTVLDDLPASNKPPWDRLRRRRRTRPG